MMNTSNLHSRKLSDQKQAYALYAGRGSFQLLGFFNGLENLGQKAHVQHGSWKFFLSLMRRPGFVIGMIIVLVLVLLAIIAPYVTPYGDHLGRYQNPDGTFSRDTGNLPFGAIDTNDPNLVHLFGTTSDGGDLWTQIWYGLGETFRLGVIVTIANVSVGIVIGLLIGYFRKVDAVFQTLFKIVQGIPILFWLVFLQTVIPDQTDIVNAATGEVIGTRGLPRFNKLIIAFVIQGWVGMALQVRAQVFRVRNLEYNRASLIMGTSKFNILVKNILPATLPIIITQIMFIIPSTILSETGLAFIGFSFDPQDVTTLGTILQSNYAAFLTNPGLLLAPVAVLLLLTLSIQLMGDNFNKVAREGAR